MLNQSLHNSYISLSLTINNIGKHSEGKKGTEKVALLKLLSTPHRHQGDPSQEHEPLWGSSVAAYRPACPFKAFTRLPKQVNHCEHTHTCLQKSLTCLSASSNPITTLDFSISWAVGKGIGESGRCRTTRVHTLPAVSSVLKTKCI